MNVIILQISIFFPLILALIILIRKQKDNFYTNFLFLIGFIVPFMCSLWLFFQYVVQKNNYYYLFESNFNLNLNYFGITFQTGLNNFSLYFYIFTNFLGLIAFIYSNFCEIQNRSKYIALLLLVQVNLIGVFISINIFFIFIFCECAIILMFILIGIWGSNNRKNSSMELILYLNLGLLSNALGLFFFYEPYYKINKFSFISLNQVLINNTDLLILNHYILYFFFIGFSILIPSFPFYQWIKSYNSMPVSLFIISEGFLKKIGLYIFIQFLYPILILQEQNFYIHLMKLNVFNILFFTILIFSQKKLRNIISYVSIIKNNFYFITIINCSSFNIINVIILIMLNDILLSFLFLIKKILKKDIKMMFYLIRVIMLVDLIFLLILNFQKNIDLYNSYQLILLLVYISVYIQAKAFCLKRI